MARQSFRKKPRSTISTEPHRQIERVRLLLFFSVPRANPPALETGLLISRSNPCLRILARRKSFILHTYEKPDLTDSFQPHQPQRPIALSSSQAQDCLWAKLSFGNFSTLFGV